MTDRFFCNFRPFKQSEKSKFWKNEKNTSRYYHLHLCTINKNHVMYDSWDMGPSKQLCLILGHFLPFYSTNNLKNENFGKIEYHTWRSHHFTLVYHKWQSYDLWFLWYGTWQTEFCFFTSLTTWKWKTLKKWKKHLQILSLYTCVP